MKNFLLGTVALVALGATVPALAADMAARTYTKAPAYVPAPIYSWTGFYIGGNVGGAFGGGNSFTGVASNSNNGKFMGGVQGGYNYQFAPNWVFGVEAQYDWTSNSGNTVVFPAPGLGYTYSSNLRGLGSVTGRLGYTWGPAMLYAKGGYAFSDRSRSVTGVAGLPAVAINSNTDGYTVGGGLEYMFTQNWSGNIEYQYYNFGKTSFATAPLATFGSVTSEQHTVKAGLNYHFNLGGAPLLAKY